MDGVFVDTEDRIIIGRRRLRQESTRVDFALLQIIVVVVVIAGIRLTPTCALHNSTIVAG